MSHPDDHDDDGLQFDDDGGGGDGGDDHFDPSQPLNLQYFGQQSHKPHEEEKFNEEQQQYDDGGGGGGGGNGGGNGGNNGGGNGSNQASNARLPEIDALSAADSLPAFANQDVRALDAQVKAKERILQKFVDEAEENQERVGVMAEHLKNVRQEREHSQQLLVAKENDIATEGHLAQLAQREYGQNNNALDGIGCAAFCELIAERSSVLSPCV